jgi:hypothetical protein
MGHLLQLVCGGEFGKDGPAFAVLQDTPGPVGNGLHPFEDRGREIKRAFAVGIAHEQVDVNGFGVAVNGPEPGRAGGERGHEPFGDGGKLAVGEVRALLQADNEMPCHAAASVVGFHEPLGVERDIIADPIAQEGLLVGQVAHPFCDGAISFDGVNDSLHFRVRAFTILAASWTAAESGSIPLDTRKL